jgi:hypothetical protein
MRACLVVLCLFALAGTASGAGEGIDSGKRDVALFVNTDGSLNMDAIRRSGYQGNLDINDFDVTFDPVTGQPVFQPSGTRAAEDDPDDIYWVNSISPSVPSVGDSVYAATACSGNLKVVVGFKWPDVLSPITSLPGTVNCPQIPFQFKRIYSDGPEKKAEMSRKRYPFEEIVRMLRQSDVELSSGATTRQVARKLAINSPCRYKKEGVRFPVERESALLADDTGLGRTVQTVSAVCRLSHSELICNRECRQSSLRYKSPAEIEMMTKPT